MTRPSMAEMSGEGDAGGSPKLPLNTIKIHGSKGTFVYQNVLGGLIEGADGKKKYETKNIGEDVKLVFLKVRRKLSQYKKGEKPLQTNEHSHKNQVVTLFGGAKPQVGVAADLREEHQGLRTQQIVYALYEGELVRVIFKGASLGSEVKDKKEHNFYSYISSFDGKDEHFYNYETELFPLEETSSMGSYYAVGFRRGRQLTDEEMKDVEEKMYIAFEHCKKVDEHYAKAGTEAFNKKAQAGAKEPVIDLEEDGTGEDEEDLNPEDIPF